MKKINFIEKQKKILNFFQTGDYDYVISECKILIKKIPVKHSLINLIGLCYQQKQDYKSAKKYYLEANKLAPDDLSILNNLGNIYKNLNDFDNAKVQYEKAISLNPNYIHALVNYGNLHKDVNNFQEAIKFFKKALDIKNDIFLVHNNIAVAYQSIGEFELAKKHAFKVIELNPHFMGSHKLLSQIIDYNKDKTHLKILEDTLKIENLKIDQKIPLNFALGKAYEDVKDYKKSFKYLSEGNKLKKQTISFNIEKEKNLFKDIKFFFKEKNIGQIKFDTKLNKRAIFILGMPRSGTTLVEQVIASHPEVYGAGELPYITSLVKEFFYHKDKIDKDKFQNFISKNPHLLHEKYFNSLTNYNKSAKVITDKAPLNFRWIGFINLLFPRSKIILCNRNAKDVCLSLYKNAFDSNKLSWTYDELDILNYYNLYMDIIKFWKKKLPDTIYTINYEKLVINEKDEIKKIINFCDLKWDEKCLNFHKNKKTPIKTASISQARKKIYRSSVNSSIHFENFLKKLFNNLN